MKITITEAAKKEILKQNENGKKVRIYVSGIG
ncbi:MULTISPECIES: iron-sulfur cluster biosynthesis family protein [Tindallia]|uniref:Iron-sulphur cluster biosynthesis n=2 Tax=Tindallia TaxID=69894 RepID=A0A1H3L4K6_9FIRM|nr:MULTISPECIES: iron-sulfur cluster biosynthesis family protein [Tindallia]SDY59270.1 Iron-sulphur cluster biosynthesis [Tindallia californiensis]